MTEQQFYEQFENATLDATIFNHSNHIKMAWIYLHEFDLPNAMSNFANALQNFATANGATNLYHETITFAFLILINERIEKSENHQNWQEFVDNNADLFNWENNILKKYYQTETLSSEFAKKHFVFPDKLPSIV